MTRSPTSVGRGSCTRAAAAIIPLTRAGRGAATCGGHDAGDTLREHGDVLRRGAAAAAAGPHRRRSRRRRDRSRPAHRAGRTGRPHHRPRRDGGRVSRDQRADMYSRPGTSRAGRIRLTGEAIRVEHFVVAERQGEAAARNIIGRRERFDAIPFFWTEQHDLGIAYVGHAEKWDEIVIDGSIEGRDRRSAFLRNGPQASGGSWSTATLRNRSPYSSPSSRFPPRAAEPAANYRRWPEVINRSIAASNVTLKRAYEPPESYGRHNESWWIACGHAGSARRRPGSTNGSRRSRRAPSCASGSAMIRGAGTSSASATERSSRSIQTC